MATVPMLKRGWLKVSRMIITSGYGTRHGRPHRGLDIDTSDSGNIILAPFSGTLYCGWNVNGYGLWLRLNGTGEYSNVQLRFGHLHNTILGNSSASNGRSITVRQGQEIGITGGWKGDRPRCGSSSGSHLHFEYRYDPSHHWLNGTDINPVSILSDKIYGYKNGVLYQRSQASGSAIRQTSGTINRVIGDIFKDDADKVIRPEDLEVTDAKSEEITILTDVNINEVPANVSEDTDWNKTEEDIAKREAESVQGLANGIWQIIKLAMDSEVTTLHVLDASLSAQTGPLVGFFNKVCQQPLVEFSGDTYGDQYYFMVRRPPFDQTNMMKTLAELGLDKSEVDDDNIYRIKSSDVIDSSITFGNNNNIYSWYQYYPVFEGARGDDLDYIIPAVFFPEFAAIWGSRDFTIRSQYHDFRDTDFTDKNRVGKASEIGDLQKAGILRDMHYLIQSNAYNPFVRQGTVNLVGNRKIKRGTFIQIDVGDGVDEIYYVEGVTQNYSINGNNISRNTSLQLSHGMVKKWLINGIENSDLDDGFGDKNIINYFNIINFGKNWKNNDNILRVDNWRDLISSWKVNRDVFNFFLKKIQFLY